MSRISKNVLMTSNKTSLTNSKTKRLVIISMTTHQHLIPTKSLYNRRKLQPK